jgi:hypothetical protein
MRSPAADDSDEILLPPSQLAWVGGAEVCSLQRARRERNRAWRGAVVVLALALLGSVVWLATVGTPSAALRGLPPAERAQVVQRAVANLRDVCRGSGRSREFCAGEARLALDQPECDAACRAVAREVLAADTAVR